MYVFGSRSKKALEGVHPNLVKVLEAAIKDSPYDFTIDAGVRTLATQQKYYTWGRSVVNPNTGPLKGRPFGAVVTKADGLRNRSNHQIKADGYGHAVDLYPFYKGKVDINDNSGTLHPIAQHIKATGKRLGIPVTWGGDWTLAKEGIVDRPHFQLT